MKVTVLSDVPVSPNFVEGNAACAFVNSTRCVSGDIFCAYRRGSAKHGPDGTLLVQRSSDGGQTWLEPVTVFDRTRQTPPESVVCGVVTAAGNTLIAGFSSVEMLNPETYIFSDEAENFPHYIRVCHSHDGGRTWADFALIDPSPYGGARSGLGTNPYLLPDGGLVFPLEVRLPSGPQATAAVVSSDRGRTFSQPHLLVGDETGKLSLCDARIIRLRDGSYLMHLWTFTCEDEKTISVHQSRSTDGINWSEATPICLQGQISAPLEVSPGFLISVCNHREQPEGSQLWWSQDGGETWTDRPIQMWDVVEGRVIGESAEERAVSKQKAVWDSLPGFSFGTPGLLLVEENVVLLTYYATIDDIIHVRACRFTVEGLNNR